MNRKQRRAAMIELPKTGATATVLQKVFESVVQHHASEIALKSYIEGAGLEGDWELDLVARLVPVTPKPIIPEEFSGQAELRERVAAEQSA